MVRLKCPTSRRLRYKLSGMAMKSSDRQATAELLAALVEVAIAHGRRHYSKSGEPLATTLAVLECLQREGFVTVEEPET
jgi:hypothetical protein